MPLPDLGEIGGAARDIWVLCGGRIDWAGLPMLAAVFDVADIELLAHWLTVIQLVIDSRKPNGRSED